MWVLLGRKVIKFLQCPLLTMLILNPGPGIWGLHFNNSIKVCFKDLIETASPLISDSFSFCTVCPMLCQLRHKKKCHPMSSEGLLPLQYVVCTVVLEPLKCFLCMTVVIKFLPPHFLLHSQVMWHSMKYILIIVTCLILSKDTLCSSSWNENDCIILLAKDSRIHIYTCFSSSYFGWGEKQLLPL